MPKKSCDIHTSLYADKYKLSLLLKNGFGILKVCKFRIPMRIPAGKSSWLFLMTSIVLCALTFMQSNARESLDKKSWSHFLYYEKSLNGKCPFANVKKFCNFDLKNLLSFYSLETNLENGNIQTGWFISYTIVNRKLLNLPYTNSKVFQIKCQNCFPFANGYLLPLKSKWQMSICKCEKNMPFWSEKSFAIWEGHILLKPIYRMVTYRVSHLICNHSRKVVLEKWF